MELLVFSDAHHRNESGQGPTGEVCSLRETVKQRKQGRKAQPVKCAAFISYKRKEMRQLTSQTSIFQMFIGWGGSPVGVGHEKAGRQARRGRGTREQSSFTSSFKMLPEY